MPTIPRAADLLVRADEGIGRYVASLRTRDIRILYRRLREAKGACKADVLVPEYGITLGEFAVATVVGALDPADGHIKSRTRVKAAPWSDA